MRMPRLDYTGITNAAAANARFKYKKTISYRRIEKNLSYITTIATRLSPPLQLAEAGTPAAGSG
jgi:hypothetical protein